MTTIAQHAEPQRLGNPRTVQSRLRTAEFSDDVEALDQLARSEVPGEVLRKIAHNPATSEATLEHLIDLDQRWLTFPVTRRCDLSPRSSTGSPAGSPTATRSSTPPALRTPPRRPCTTWRSTRPLPRPPQRPSLSVSARAILPFRDHAGLGNREETVDRARLLEPSADSS